MADIHGLYRFIFRLPNIKELQSLIDFGEINPALPSGHPFTGVQSYVYWSSTSRAVITYYAWYLSMNDGYMTGGIKANDLYVWPVRSDN